MITGIVRPVDIAITNKAASEQSARETGAGSLLDVSFFWLLGVVAQLTLTSWGGKKKKKNELEKMDQNCLGTFTEHSAVHCVILFITVQSTVQYCLLLSRYCRILCSTFPDFPALLLFIVTLYV